LGRAIAIALEIAQEIATPNKAETIAEGSATMYFS
jgi:hypothetical protein